MSKKTIHRIYYFSHSNFWRVILLVFLKTKYYKKELFVDYKNTMRWLQNYFVAKF